MKYNCTDRNGNSKKTYSTFEVAQKVADFENQNRGVVLRVYQCENCGLFHLTNDNKRKDDVDNALLWRNFYFKNALDSENENYIKSIQGNLDRDFSPFSDFLKRSKDNINNRSSVFAECFSVKEETSVLNLEGELLKIDDSNNQTQLILMTPENFKNYRIVHFIDSENVCEFKNVDFEIVQGRDTIICNQSSVIKNKNELIVNIQDEQKLKKIDDSKEFKFWIGDSDYQCNLLSLNESFLRNNLNISIKIETVKILNNEIHISTKNKISDDVTFSIFDKESKINLKIKSISKNQFDVKSLSMTNTKLSLVKDNYFLATPKANGKLLSRQKLIHYTKIISSKEIFNILKADEKSKNVQLINNRLILKDTEFVNKNIKLANLSFNVTKEKSKFQSRLKDQKGNVIGTFVELKENEELIDDINSNLDYFFSEDVDLLSDIPDAKKQNDKSKVNFYKVGKTYVDENTIEIAKCDMYGKQLQKIEANNIPSKLYLVPDTTQIQKQMDALFHLRYMPNKTHFPLMQLTDDKNRAKWKEFFSVKVATWYKLTNLNYDGCSEQRDWVNIALSTPDFAFLDGPPGSGKTTAILEYICQMVNQNKKVLLAASTNAAVDNILERIEDLPEEIRKKILAVRFGNENSISDTVKSYSVQDYSDDIKNEIISRANLVCGTIIGILKHPDFTLQKKDCPIIPIYDSLIIDEVSKTTFQEFLIPALYAKRWIFSGDLKQLTPYTEQDNFIASFELLPKFGKIHQSTQTKINYFTDLYTKKLGGGIQKYCLIFPIKKEHLNIAYELSSKQSDLRICILGTDESKDICVSYDDFVNGKAESVYVYASQIIFCDENVPLEVQKNLPKNFLFITNNKDKYFYSHALNCGNFCNQNLFSIPIYNRGKKSNTDIFLDNIFEILSSELKENNFAKEIIWRICRIAELNILADNDTSVEKKISKLNSEIDNLLPKKENNKNIIKDEIDLLFSIALPSVLQLLQTGISKNVVKNRKSTTLNSGFIQEVLNTRRVTLSYQHRMHSEIADFSSKNIYNGKALQTATECKHNRNWNYKRYNMKHSIWVDVKGNGDANQNKNEVHKICTELKDFIEFSKNNPKERENWEVAILTYYKKQERNLKEEVKKIMQSNREKNFYKDDTKHIEVKIFTVDKFQGQEADLVFLSLVKSQNTGLGFMDNPNRLNVALTRARFMRVIVGDKEYFEKCSSELLKKLAKETKLYEGK